MIADVRVDPGETERTATTVESALHQQVRDVLALLSRARELFGGDQAPADAPAFVSPPDLERRLGGAWS